MEEIEVGVTADTSGGSIQLEEIRGWADVHTSGGSIRFVGVAGELSGETSGDSIRGEDVGEDADVDTSGGSIELRGMAGAVNASTSGGSVTVHFARGNSRGGTLHTSDGRVTGHVDPEAALDIDASTSGGGVTLDFPVTVQGKLSKNSVNGTLNGGGPTLRLRSSGGRVSILSL